MSAFRINQEEIEALSRSDTSSNISHAAKLVYLLAIRPFMDFATGFVGNHRTISYQSIRETIEYMPSQGSKRKEIHFSRDNIQSLLDELVRYGLIEWIKTNDRGLVFFCPLADRDNLAKNMSTPRAPHENPQKITPVITPVIPIITRELVSGEGPHDHPITPNVPKTKSTPPPEVRITGEEEQGFNTLVVETEFLPISASDDPVKRVFGYWQEVLHKPGHKLDGKRRKAIASRLGDGYTVEQLMAAIRGCAATPFNQGQNKGGTVFDDIELICRDASHTDRFIGAATKQQSKTDEWADFLAMDRVIKGECSHG